MTILASVHYGYSWFLHVHTLRSACRSRECRMRTPHMDCGNRTTHAAWTPIYAVAAACDRSMCANRKKTYIVIHIRTRGSDDLAIRPGVRRTHFAAG